jgi:hypothetical protein
MSVAMKFVCVICNEASFDICVWCTKDVCSSHRCARCRRCSDCCPCERPLESEPHTASSTEQ